MTDESNPFSHIHKGIDHMSKPANDISKMETLGWGLDAEKMNPQVDGKEGLNQEELETLTYLTEADRVDLAIEKVFARASMDLPALAFAESYARGSIAVKGRGRTSIEKMVGGSTPKISVPTTMQKVRRVFSGRGEKKEQVGSEEEWVNE